MQSISNTIANSDSALTKSERLVIVMSASLKEALALLAAQQCVTMSDLIRAGIYALADKHPAFVDLYTQQLKKHLFERDQNDETDTNE